MQIANIKKNNPQPNFIPAARIAARLLYLTLGIVERYNFEGCRVEVQGRKIQRWGSGIPAPARAAKVVPGQYSDWKGVPDDNIASVDS